jgi:DNA mismatch endonuclease, patch repair protein
MAAPIMPRVPSYAAFAPASAAASDVKRRNRRDGGRAEHLLRRAIWRAGLRYRTHRADLPGRPDLVFSRARLCVFVDGDFWHGRNWPELRDRLKRRANPDYWIPKIARNVERDAEHTGRLQAAGWTVIRLWETDVLRDTEAAAQFVVETITRLNVVALDEGAGVGSERCGRRPGAPA